MVRIIFQPAEINIWSKSSNVCWFSKTKYFSTASIYRIRFSVSSYTFSTSSIMSVPYVIKKFLSSETSMSVHLNAKITVSWPILAILFLMSADLPAPASPSTTKAWFSDCKKEFILNTLFSRIMVLSLYDTCVPIWLKISSLCFLRFSQHSWTAESAWKKTFLQIVSLLSCISWASILLKPLHSIVIPSNCAVFSIFVWYAGFTISFLELGENSWLI